MTEQFLKLIDKIDFNETGVQMKFEDELKRRTKFNRGVLGIQNPSLKHEEIDLRTYAKYILREGTNKEKQELTGCFKSQITMMNGVIKIESENKS